MSENEEKDELNLSELDEVVNLNEEEIKLPEQKIQKLYDGVEVISDVIDSEEVEEEKEEISDKDLRKLVQFTTGVKDLTDEELESLRNDERELERLIRISIAKSKHLNYHPKKHFGVAYRKERQRKNKQAKKSRAINRK